MDIAEPASAAAALARHKPWAVINAAGFARVDGAELQPERCRRENVRGVDVLGAACRAAGVPLLAFSSHLVFDGGRDAPYTEDDAPAPLSVYGAAKLEAERRLLDADPDALVVRSGPAFGPWDDRNLAARAIRAVAGGRFFPAACDVTVSPSYLPDVVNVALDLLMDGERGVWHLANTGAVTWAEFARGAVRDAGLDPQRVLGVPAADLNWKARRPAYSALRSVRGAGLPSLDDALRRYRAERPEDLVLHLSDAEEVEA
ncbi:MAG TPA: sugar nucleotide-binding protein, partial [Azospirillum sp.]